MELDILDPQVERIDGQAYLYGSPEHGRAIDRAIARTQRTIAQSEIGHRFDANQTAFLARDLVYISRDAQKVIYETLRAVEFVPITTEIPRGATEWGYRQIDITGEARIGAHLHTDDAPNADTAVEEFTFPVTHLTASYQYTLDELEKAAYAGVSLSRDKAMAAAEIIARGIDKVLRIGDVSQGITGFFNNPNVPILTLTNGEWLTATADEQTADLQEVEQTVITQTRDAHKVTRLLLPTAYEGVINDTLRGSGTDTTVKGWFLKNSRMIKEIERWMALDDATGDDVGVADPPQGVAYAPDPAHVRAEIPVPYEELPPQARNFGWVVPCRAVCAGVTFKRPLSALYLENLD